MNPKQENSMLVDVQYVKPTKSTNNIDYMYLIWKDLDTMKKHLQVVKEPKMDIYFEKKELRTHNYNKDYEKIENLDKVTCKYKDIKFLIAEDIGPGGKDFLMNCYKTHDYESIKKIFLYPYTFGSDYDVASWYRIQWVKKLHNNRPKVVTKGFLDIEVDGLEAKGMPDPVSCPINAVTLIDDGANDVYTFLYIDRPFHESIGQSKEENAKRKEMYEEMHRQQHELMNNMDEFIKELHDAFDESYGELTYHLYFYKDEIEMMVHLFQLVHALKLDIIGIWNISFDMPYIYDRLVAKGLDPAEVICHPDFPVKTCYFKADTKNHDIKNKSDNFYCSDYTTWIDQMETYAHVRKGGSEIRSYRLTDIAQKELHDEKLDYSDDADIKTLPYVNFKKFVMYNIKDVLLQKGIENVTLDFNTIYARSYMNATPYDKIFRQTVVLRNAQYLSFLSQGLIPGNNINIFNTDVNPLLDKKDDDDDDDDGYAGALVADPQYNGKIGQKLFGKTTTNIFLHGIDFDMSAFYPYSVISNNIGKSTLIFKTILPMDQYDIYGGEIPFHGITASEFLNENPTNGSVVDGAKECIDNFQTKNYMVTGHKWMNMPDVSQVYSRLKEKLKK